MEESLRKLKFRNCNGSIKKERFHGYLICCVLDIYFSLFSGLRVKNGLSFPSIFPKRKTINRQV